MDLGPARLRRCLSLLALPLCLGCVISSGGEPLPGYENEGKQGGGGGGNTPGGGDSEAKNVTTGAAWMPATSNLTGLESECGTIQSMASRTDRDMIIVGVARQGLWASTDNSPMWTKLGQGAGSAVIVNRPTAVVFDPAHPDTFWEAGIYNQAGVYRTTDNGNSFTQLGDTHHNDLVAVDFTDPERKTLLAGSHEGSGFLLRSTDGGMTWTDIGSKLPMGIGASSLPYLVDSRTYLLGTYNSPMAGVFRTTDGGETWSPVVMGAMRNGPTLGFDGTLFWSHDSGGAVRSTDRGVTWTELPNNPKTGLTIVELPDHRLIAAQEKRLQISTDRGVSWKNFGPALPWDTWGIVYGPRRKAIYAFQLRCGSGNPVLVEADQILRLDFDYQQK